MIAAMSLTKTVSPETAPLVVARMAPQPREQVKSPAGMRILIANSAAMKPSTSSAGMGAEIRKLIQPFCEPDPNCKGDPPTYVNNTLQLDSPGLSLHYAKLWDFVDRFKLRVRTYGNPVGDCPIFLEVKGKDRNMVFKYRSQIPLKAGARICFRIKSSRHPV